MRSALVATLRSGHIAGVGLDVFATEPLPASHSLTAFDNVLLTPHVACNTPEATVKLLDIASDNVAQYAGGSPINVLNPR
jgi:D-3-phosphoglycerate dehydrogenase